MQVSFNKNENQFKVPHYKVGDEVLALVILVANSLLEKLVL